MKKILFVIVPCLVFLTACIDNTNKVGIASVNSNVDMSKAILEIQKADIAWDSLAGQNSAEGWLSFYTDDAIMMPPGEKACTDKASRAVSIKNTFALPGVSLRFQGTKTEVSKSGELGYTIGVYQLSTKDATGKETHETGRFCETWKKQSDGNWKCIVDIWNADPAK